MAGGRIFVGALALVALTTVAPEPAGAATTWTIQASPNRGTVSNWLGDVSCPTATRCVAVGAHRNDALPSAPPYGTLIETFTQGKWSVTASPGQNRVNALWGVSCPTVNRCYAVGTSIATNQALIATLSGGAWSPMPTPDLGDASGLSGISCVDASHCFAVGWAGSVGAQRTLVLALSSGAWSVMPSPNRGTSGNGLESVSCSTAESCVAVGIRLNGSYARTLAIRLSGGIWTLMTTPNRTTKANWLKDVSCPTSTRCTAVGSYVNQTDIHRTLIETWSGGVWSAVPSPNRGAAENELSDVSCVDATHCIAVGSGNHRTVVESLAGGAWSIVPSPNQDPWPGSLNGVDCLSSSVCVAVGQSLAFTPTSFASRTLVLRSGPT